MSVLTNDDVWDYLRETGASSAFSANLDKGQRLGQAFFNALLPSEGVKLVETEYDPFYKNDWESLCTTVEYLLTAVEAER